VLGFDQVGLFRVCVSDGMSSLSAETAYARSICPYVIGIPFSESLDVSVEELTTGVA
jgi:hypothetical protein